MTDPWNAPDPATPWSAPDKPLAAMPDSYAEDRAEVPRNHYGQYLIPSADGRQPANGKGRPRVSTIAKIGPNTDRLQQRAERLVVAGLAKDPAINAAAMKAEALQDDTKEKRAALQKVAASAFAVAGGHDRANRGTRIHQLVEDIKRGKDVEVPEELRTDVDAYFAVLEKHGLEFMPEFMERVVLCPYDSGGAIDDIMRRWNPDTEMYEFVVVDTKTGASLDFSRLPILSQLWMYANALCFFVTTDIERDKDGKITAVRGYQEDMPLELRRDKAVIIHLDGLGAAHYYEIDISGHGRVVAAQIEIKRADTEAHHKFRLVGSIMPDVYVKAVTNIPPGPVYNESFPVTSGPATSSAVSGTGYSAMIEQTFGDRATDTMRAQAAAADARVEISPGITTRPELAAALAAEVATLDGMGKPLGPLADRSKGERGCSVCGRKGHKSTSPKCLKDQDPAKLKDRAARDAHAVVAPVLNGDYAEAVDAAAAPGRNDDPDDLGPQFTLRDYMADTPITDRDDYYALSVPADGVEYPAEDIATIEGTEWVKHRLPPLAPLVLDHVSASAEPSGPYAPTRDLPNVAAPTAPLQPEQSLLPYCDGLHPGPCGWHSDPSTGDYVCATSGKPSRMVWESRQPVDFVLNSIAARATVQDLLTFRQGQIAAGQWQPHHEVACLARHTELSGGQ
jgi:hypothetical protein